ncbi:hypothetical protein KIW84_044306 [Lathyrus oleraceus]|uniref:Arginyl-tRNA synthetase catalytic core domain-containing protein n=1 Tax=Pisum sativum TaxID=3888 RepID=A0A9D5AQ84_PEA|nr:hypothetical protein KIW84_044306 [Pisum sativum]
MMESTSQYWLIRWWMRDVSSLLCGCRGDELGITKLHAQEQPVALKIVVKRDGGYNYSSTDLTSTWYCLDVENIEWNIYVTDVGQWQHFDMLFKAYRRFRTRNTEIVRLDELLDEAKRRCEL